MEIIGHKKQLKMLSFASAVGRVHYAYLFAGQVGIGKKLAALEFAKMLNCRSSPPAKKPCGVCASCRKIESGTHPDVMTVSVSEDKSWISIDQIRNVIKSLQFSALMGGYNVRIIDDAHLIKEDAVSALLKVLEEPPEKTIIILITSVPRTMPQTIISRCATVYFDLIADGEIKNEIKKYGLTDDEADFVTSVAAGSLGKALEISRSRDLIAEYRNVLTDFKDGKYADKRFGRKDAVEFLNILAGRVKMSDIKKLEDVLRAKNYIRRNVNIGLALDVLRLKMLSE